MLLGQYQFPKIGSILDSSLNDLVRVKFYISVSIGERHGTVGRPVVLVKGKQVFSSNDPLKIEVNN
jgi:hypothetical protein